MTLNPFKNTVLLFLFVLISCGNNRTSEVTEKRPQPTKISVGANDTAAYLPLLKGKHVGIVANQTSVIFNASGHTHLVDSLLKRGVNIKKVFAPEHGFRGQADAGEVVKDGVDIKTGLPIISLYGKNRKPSKDQLKDVDVVLFDIQDVGARFYTYISSLHYVMEACAKQNKMLVVLDRPNPNGRYVDGPILELEHKSFVGMHPVPVVHGMTIGEYAQMINGEKWLDNGLQCDLTVIRLSGYWRDRAYSLPIRPSPNLPNDQAINLYPSLCFFEGTNVSAGRGTEMQFQIFGSPFLNMEHFSFAFVPQPNAGARYPKHKAVQCFGKDLRNHQKLDRINLEWLIEAYNGTSDKTVFFNNFLTKLAGTETLRRQIEQGYTAQEIRKTWMSDVVQFKRMRSKYLLYD